MFRRVISRTRRLEVLGGLVEIRAPASGMRLLDHPENVFLREHFAQRLRRGRG